MADGLPSLADFSHHLRRVIANSHRRRVPVLWSRRTYQGRITVELTNIKYQVNHPPAVGYEAPRKHQGRSWILTLIFIQTNSYSEYRQWLYNYLGRGLKGKMSSPILRQPTCQSLKISSTTTKNTVQKSRKESSIGWTDVSLSLPESCSASV